MIKIAVCDDERLCLEDAKNSIYKWADENDVTIEVSSFDNGDAFIGSHKKEDFDLVFLDIMMPLLNGMELAHEIRKYDKAIKILENRTIFIENRAMRLVDDNQVKTAA